ncbi:MAG: hypothetical protein ABI665_21965 [Vicinamibacterales bacterium]
MMSAPATPKRALSTVLVLAGLVSTAAGVWTLWYLGGWEYYRTPIVSRGYMAAHRLLRPSGSIGLPLGVAGMVAMVSTLPYAARKHWRPLARFGPASKWLEVHIFFGIIGPVLVTLHTAFKFNGVIAVGYWLMMTVWSSGFVGRYLYVRIPKTIRGVELSRSEMAADLERTRSALSMASLPPAAWAALEEFDRSVEPAPGRPPGLLDLFFGELRVRTRLFLMQRHLRAAGADIDAIHTAVTRATEHATLVRRVAHLERTRRLFALWHVFHRPLVYLMFLIVGLHVAIAVYLGYAQLLLMAAR